MKSLFKNISVKSCIIIVVGCLIQAVGIYNIHSISGVTEGGVLGLLLLLEYWIHLSPAISCVILNAICYLIGYKALGKDFIVYSILSIVTFSIFYSILECFPRIYPNLANYPLIAAVLGGIFIGVGAGLTVKFGAASSGDDAIAMTISKKFNVKIQTVYLVSDLTVMLLSLTYIPFSRIIYSLLTVIISGQIIGFMVKEKDKDENKIDSTNEESTNKAVETKSEETTPNNIKKTNEENENLIIDNTQANENLSKIKQKSQFDTNDTKLDSNN
ncbi:MAG: YitT family protein [Clostridia bacterium]|nr:YitT family protein [Clostridia bacterium]